MDISAASLEGFYYDSKSLAFAAFSAKEANLFLHNHLESRRFDINEESYT